MIEYDSAWKEIIEELFEDFMLFFFPEIHTDIDWSKGYAFLDKELQKIIKSSETGRRHADKLAKVYLRDGSEKWLLIHVEVQGYEQAEFPERMFVYNYRLFDKFKREVASLALLTDENPNYRVSEYQRSRWGCEVIFRYPIVKLIDYRERWNELEVSSNPFAIAVMAYLKALEARGNDHEKYTWKKHFLVELYRRGLTREKILALYKFIDWIITVPEELENEIFEEVKAIEEATMPHITTAERIGIKKGKQEGIAESIATVHKVVGTVIELKFGEAGQGLSERTKKLRSLEVLQQLTERLKRASNMNEAEKIFDELELAQN
ncbi:cytosolic protein [candidate division KSB1 bacterium]|nr:cytosolic protein [candidate division KSB1 bacterium]